MSTVDIIAAGRKNRLNRMMLFIYFILQLMETLFLVRTSVPKSNMSRETKSDVKRLVMLPIAREIAKP
jgi:hypothetical protein